LLKNKRKTEPIVSNTDEQPITKPNTQTLRNDITNYFADYKSANSHRKQELHELLGHEAFINAVILDDQTIQHWLSQPTTTDVWHDDHHKLSRLFLNAIIVPPGQWTALFARELEKGRDFARKTEESESTQKSGIDLYPEELRLQLLWLFHEHGNLTDPNYRIARWENSKP